MPRSFFNLYAGVNKFRLLSRGQDLQIGAEEIL